MFRTLFLRYEVITTKKIIRLGGVSNLEKVDVYYTVHNPHSTICFLNAPLAEFVGPMPRN